MESANKTRAWTGSFALPLVILGAYALFIVAWIFSNPLGAAPDEVAHYTKSLQVGSGVLLGPPISQAEFVRIWANDPKEGQAQIKTPLNYLLSRKVFIPPALDPGNSTCTAFLTEVSAKCEYSAPARTQEINNGTETYVTYIGTYQPFVYLPAGIVMNLAKSRDAAWYAGRLAFAAISFAFISIAFAFQWRRRNHPTALLGLVIGTTPMVIATMSTITSSGIEISSGIAFWAGLLYLARTSNPSPWAWSGAIVSGTVLALSRSLSPLWIVLTVLIVAVSIGRHRTIELIKRARIQSTVMTAVIVFSCALNVWWQLGIQPHVSTSLHAAAVNFIHSFNLDQGMLTEGLGIFGWLDTPMPLWAYPVFDFVIAVFVGLAWVVSDRQRRRALALGLGLLILVPPTLNALVAIPAGGGVQARWILPFASGFALLIGDSLYQARGAAPLARVRLAPPALVAMALLLFVAWYQNSRRYAVGASGRLLFFRHPEWTPPGGWMPWFVLIVLATGLLLMAARIAYRPKARI